MPPPARWPEEGEGEEEGEEEEEEEEQEEQEEEEEALHVLDLPQLYTKPSAEILLSTLADLSSAPISWQATPRSATPRSSSGPSTPYRQKRKVKSEGLPSYLTKIVISQLAWIEDDAAKERIWEAASQRLAERSGRTAMGAIERTFVIPLQPYRDQIVGNSSNETLPSVLSPHACLELTLHEPALTGDSLGLKTWASSYLLAKRMTLLHTSLPPLPMDTTVLELGSGTGLVGLAAAAILSRHVILTDLPDILPNLERNAGANASSLSLRGGQTTCSVLDWNQPERLHLDDSGSNHAANTFSLVLAADPLYSPDHPRLLANAVRYHLRNEQNARVVVEMPLRDAFVAERDDFRARMGAIGLHIVDEGEEVGFDDWSSGKGEELLEVPCWWSVWARR